MVVHSECQNGGKKEENKKLTAPGIPRGSPAQVLIRPDAGWLPRSDEIGRVPRGMAVSKYPDRAHIQ